MDTHYKDTAESALLRLLDKYGIVPEKPVFLNKHVGRLSGNRLVPGDELLGGALEGGEIPLLTWRVKRSFVELRKMVDEATVKEVCLLRFSCLASSEEYSLDSLIYREADLCEYITGSRIKTVFAVCDHGRSANIIARMEAGILCSIEISLTLPRNKKLQERHELIGRRGAASDRVVDTQVPQHSVYSFTRAGSECFTDTDNELFGLSSDEIAHVRGAFEVCKNPNLQAAWTEQHQHLTQLIKAVMASSESRQRVNIS